mmetsp:Transcript_30726/g.78409  ORF Transcript_30726/g.78409 Transcript_30726/m.78409 type:complete len:338 (+) Transcript_30726:1550-2563(+)
MHVALVLLLRAAARDPREDLVRLLDGGALLREVGAVHARHGRGEEDALLALNVGGHLLHGHGTQVVGPGELGLLRLLEEEELVQPRAPVGLYLPRVEARALAPLDHGVDVGRHRVGLELARAGVLGVGEVELRPLDPRIHLAVAAHGEGGHHAQLRGGGVGQRRPHELALRLEQLQVFGRLGRRDVDDEHVLVDEVGEVEQQRVPEDAQLVPLGHELDALRVRAARAHLDRILGRGHRRAEHEVALPLMRHLDAAQHLVLRRAVGDHNPPLDVGARRDHLVDLARLRDQEVCRLDRLLGEQLVQPLLVAIVECLLRAVEQVVGGAGDAADGERLRGD